MNAFRFLLHLLFLSFFLSSFLLFFNVHWCFACMYLCELLDPLELELRAAMWVLQLNLGSLEEQPNH